MSWLCFPLMCATKPTPQASRSWRGSYRPCCIGKEESLTVFPNSYYIAHSLKPKNGGTCRHVKYKSERAGILPCLGTMGNRSAPGDAGTDITTCHLIRLANGFA